MNGKKEMIRKQNLIEQQIITKFGWKIRTLIISIYQRIIVPLFFKYYKQARYEIGKKEYNCI